MNRLILMLAIVSLSTNSFAGGKRQAERAWNVEVELVKYELGTWSWLADDLVLARSLWKEGHLEQSEAVLQSLSAALQRDRARIDATLGESTLQSFDHALTTFHQERSASAGFTLGLPALPRPGLGLRADESTDDESTDDDTDRSRESRREAERGQREVPEPADRQERPLPGGER